MKKIVIAVDYDPTVDSIHADAIVMSSSTSSGLSGNISRGPKVIRKDYACQQ